MNSSETNYDCEGTSGQIDRSLDIEEIDADALLEKAEYLWGEKSWDITDEEACFARFVDENATYDVSIISEYDELNVKLSYDFEKPERNCNENMDALWDIYVQPVIREATEVANYS